MAVGRTNSRINRIEAIPDIPTPGIGFVPTAWDADGLVTHGRWYGDVIFSNAFTGLSSALGVFSKLVSVEHENVISIGVYAFRYCSIHAADFPLATIIDHYAFQGCKNLVTINFPSATRVGMCAFDGCNKIKTANFPYAESLDSWAFRNCISLTTANFPYVESIGGSFYGCTNIAKLDIPRLEKIYSESFYGCTKLNTLILRRNAVCTLYNSNAFTNTPIANGTGYIYVPKSRLNSYKIATNWVTYANQIRAIEDYPAITGG